MDDDATLLLRYAETQDGDAFATLLRRHVDFVYSVALRRVHGDAHLAHDVSQQVFIALARRAAALARHPCLLGWLHTCACQRAADLVRSEARRRAREAVAATDRALTAEPPVPWENLAPELDLALQTLGERDREAILLRYFAQKSFADIAAALGSTEAAAQMRATRALEKLRRALAARGVTSTASALGLALGANAVSAAPASVATATLVALGTVSVAATATGTSMLTLMTTSTKLTLGVTAAVLAAVGLGWGVYRVQEAPLNATASQSASIDSVSPAAPPAADAATTPTNASRSASTATHAPTLADALALADAFKRKLALSALGHDTAASDPKRAFDLLAQIQASADRASFIEGMMAAAAKMPPADAVAFAADLTQGEDRRVGLVALATNWGVDLNDSDAVDYIRTVGLEGALGVLVAVQNPERGVAWAEGLLDGASRRQALHDSMRQLARSDPKAALAYANTATDPDERRSLLTGVALGWSENDGPAAHAWASSVSADPDTRAELVAAATLFWARKDLAAATHAALSQPPDLRTRSLVTIATSLYQRDPAGAADWLETLPNDSTKKEVRDALDKRRREGYMIHNADGSATILAPGGPVKN